MATLQPAPSPLAPPTPTAHPPLAIDTAPPDDGSSDDPTKKVEAVEVDHAKQPDAPKFTPQGLANREEAAEERADADYAKMEALKDPPLELPTRKKDNYTNPVEAWGSIAMLAAAAGSLFTRAPLTTALNSAAGVMNGMHAADQEAAKLHYDEWKENTEIAIKKYEFQNNAIKGARELLKSDAEAGFAAVKNYGVALGHQAYVDAADKRDKRAIERIHQTDVRIANDFYKNAVKVEQGKQFTDDLKKLKQDPKYIAASPEDKRAMQMSITPAGLVPQGAYDLMATTYIKTQRMPSDLTIDMKPKFWASVARQRALENAKGTSDEKIIANQGTFRADVAALTSAKKTMTAGNAFERTAEDNMKTTEKLMPSGASASTLGPFWNKWVQEGRVAFGDAKVPAFEASLITVADEYAKVISGSTGAAGSTDAARAQAAKIINEYFSKGQIKAVFAVMRKDMKNKTMENFEGVRGLRKDMMDGTFDTPEEVGEAVQTMGLDPEDGQEILRDQFGYE